MTSRGGKSYWSQWRKVRANVTNHIQDLISDSSDLNAPSTDDSEEQILLEQVSQNVTNEYPVDQNVEYDGFYATNNDEYVSDEMYDEIFNQHLNFIDDTESESSSDENDQECFSEQLREWAVVHQVPNIALSDLLRLLKPFHPQLPRDPRTLLKTKTSYNILDICGGQYYHFGLTSSLKSKIIPHADSFQDGFCFDLQINIDGLPLFKSTSHQFWPILAQIKNTLKPEPFIIGLFSGQSKPNDVNEYLKRFLDEYIEVSQNGFEFEGKHWYINIHSVICDAPARAYVKCVKSYSGYHGCDKCAQNGEWQGKMTFPEVNARLRTDQSFQLRLDEDHHTGISPFSNINIGMVSQFPIDYMHLICLGVMKRLLMLWIKGPLQCRLGSMVIGQISSRLLSLRDYIPCEFARRPRSLREIDRWKATEFRQFLLYTGPVVLSQLLHPNMYKNFLLLCVGIHILINENLAQSHSDYATQIITTFVTHFCQMYGMDLSVYNVHASTHLAEDARKFGSLECISAFPFENFLSKLKKMVRKPHYPLQQIIRRLSEQNVHVIEKEKSHIPVLKIEHNYGPLPHVLLTGNQYKWVRINNMTLKLNIKDSCVRVGGFICLIQNIVKKEGDIFIVYKKFQRMEDFYTIPLCSSHLGILKVSQLSNTLHTANITDIQAKCVILPYRGSYVAFPYSDAVWSEYKFAVVEFLEEHEVEVVPFKWLSENNKQCHWPSYKSMSKVQMAVKQMIAPTTEFQRLPVRVLYKTDDYSKARQKLKLSEVTSDLQTEAEDETQNIQKKRKKRPNPRYGDDNDDDDDDDETEDEEHSKSKEPRTRRTSPRKGRTLPELPPMPMSPFSNTVSSSPEKRPSTSYVTPNRTLMDLTPRTSQRSSPEKRPSTSFMRTPNRTLMDLTPRTSQPSAVEIKMLTCLETVKAQVHQNTQLLQAILKKMDGALVAEEACDFPEESFPMCTHLQLDTLENKLKENEIFNKLVRSLSTIGGENVKLTTRRILSYLFDNDLAQKINWMGKGGKIAFSKLRIKDAISKCVRRNRLTSSATDSEIYSVAKDWFRFAADRAGGRKKREERKRNSLNVENNEENVD